MHFNKFTRVLLFLLPLVLSIGCRRSVETTPTDIVEDPTAMDTVEALYMEADMLLIGGQTNEAQRVLSNALTNPALVAERPRLFNLLIRFLLHSHDTEQAKTRMLAMLRTDPEVARGSLEDITMYFQQQNDLEAAIAWNDTVLGLALPEPMRSEIMRSRIELTARHEDTETHPKILRRILADFTPETALRLTRTLMDSLVANRRFDVLDTLLPTLREARSTLPDIAPIHQEMDIRIQIAREQWSEAVASFESALTALSDTSLARLFRSLADGMRRHQDWQALDSLCTRLLDIGAEHTRLIDSVARQWLQLAADHHGADAIPERIGILLMRQFNTQTVYDIFSRHYYATIDHVDALREMLAIVDRLMTVMNNENHRANLRLLTLDGSFMLEDYGRAIALIEEGIPGRDASWHALALTKLKAHKAIHEDRPLDAVTHLRAFMEALRQSPDEQTTDPVTGLIHTRDMLLGRNSRRIGELLDQAGKPEEAIEANNEARAYYRNAVNALGMDSPSGRLALTELQAIPER